VRLNRSRSSTKDKPMSLFQVMRGAGSTLRPYDMHLFLLAFTIVLLYADGRLLRLGPQIGLGVVTFGVLLGCARRVDKERRLQLWICIPVATCFEVLGSLIWGGYRYRLHNIPLYVPPGHALVYLFGISALGLPLVARHGREFRYTVLALCTAWSIAGLTFLPLLTGRLDVSGALIWPLFAWCILYSGRGELFAAIWIATTTLEIAGTWAGDWTWVAVTPWTHVPSGNPPSAIAAGYAVIDGSVVLLAPLVLFALRRLGRLLPGRPPVPSTAPSTASGS
jgi:hypothetical protein